MTRARLRMVQRIFGTLGILIALSALATTFLPFRILEVQCGPAITGSKVEIGGPRGSLVQYHEAPICHNKGSSRLITAGVVFVLAAGLGYAGWFLPLGPSWLTEDEEEVESSSDRPAAAGRDWSDPPASTRPVRAAAGPSRVQLPRSPGPTPDARRPTKPAGRTSARAASTPVRVPVMAPDSEPVAPPARPVVKSPAGGRQIPPIPQGGGTARERRR